MTISCAVKFCNNKIPPLKNISFFRFPSDHLRCKQWIENCHTVHLLNKDPAFLYKNYRLCGVHFEDNMFFIYMDKEKLFKSRSAKATNLLQQKDKLVQLQMKALEQEIS